MSTPPPTPSTPPPVPLITPARRWFRPWPRTWRGWLLAICATVVLILGTTWLLSRSAPPWYAPLDVADQRVIDLSERGQNVLLDLHNKLQRVPRAEQTWEITQDELNSYIAIQFARAVDANGGNAAPVISAPMVVFTPGQVTVSARTTRLPSPNKAGGVASLVFDVRMTTGPDGKPAGLVQLTGVWAGCMPVPRSVIDTRLRALLPTITAALQQAIQSQFNLRESSEWGKAAEEVVHRASEGEPFPLTVRLDRGKQVAIKDFKVEAEKFSVVMALPPGVAGTATTGR